MINAYLQDSITIRKVTYDQWGSPSTSDVSTLGRFEFKTKLVRNDAGEQVVSSANVLLKSDASVEHEDKIVYAGKVYSIINIEIKKDFTDRMKKVILA
jgi:hypothetical protein